MLLPEITRRELSQLVDAIGQLPAADYGAAVNALSGAGIGQHVRHVIDMLHCLETGYESGRINYEHRERDAMTENDPAYAITRLRGIISRLQRPDKELALEAGFDLPGQAIIPTNYYRELLYNLEHAIHHMALIKIGIREKTTVSLPASFGVAPSTLKYQESCAQ